MAQPGSWPSSLAGVAVWLLLDRKSHAGAENMLADLTADIERGGVTDLGRAQAVGRHLAFTNPRNRDAAAGLAYTNATLAADYGMDTSRETADALARVGSTAPPDAASVIAGAARALDRLHAGDREAAGRRLPRGPRPPVTPSCRTRCTRWGGRGRATAT